MTATGRLEIGVERGTKKAFAWALDWPGWCRSGKDPDLAQAALLAAAPTLRGRRRGGRPGPPADRIELEVVETVAGDGGTDFGVPSAITDLDRRPVSAGEAERLAALVEAAWTVFERVAAAAPAELRKGPRGGGRDTDRMIEHVDGADDAYAGVMGIKVRAQDRAVAGAVEAMRAAMLDVAPPAVGRLAHRRAQVAAALCRAPDRLARARPRLGDRGPDRALVGGGCREERRHLGRLDRPGRIDEPDRRGSLADHRPAHGGPRPGARGSRSPRRPSRACGRPAAGPARGGRTSPARRRRAASRAGSGPASTRGGRVRGRRGRCPATGRPRRRRTCRSSCRAGRGSAGRPPRTPRPRTARRTRPSIAPCRRRARRAAPARRGRARDSRPGSPRPPSRGRSPRPTRRRSSASSRSRRRGRPHGASRAHAWYGASSSDWRSGPESATNPSQARSSSSAVSNSGRQRWRSWSSMRRITRPPAARAIPHTATAFATWPRWR